MNKKIYKIICLCMIAMLTLGSVGCSKKNKDIETTAKPPAISDTEDKKALLETLVGVYTGKMIISDNPVKLEGQMFIPKDNVDKLVQYFIKKQKTGDIKNLNIMLQDGSINLKLNYKALGFINAPVQLTIVPSIQNGDIVLEVKDIKASGIKIDNQTLLGILKSAVASEKNVSVDEKSIIINKEKFDSIEIDDIKVDNENITIDVKIPMDKLLENQK